MVKIAVVGAGYVGLVTGTCLAQKGYFVTIVENNQNKINALLNGQVPFYEPGLDELVKENINSKRILFVSTIKEALEQKPEVIFSCVGTPPNEDGSADLSYVLQVAVEVGKSITQYCLVVNKSTVSVGSAEKVKQVINTQLADRGVSVEFDVASNPEFLKEGDALSDFLNPDRIVIGVESKRAQDILTRIYSPFITNEDQLLVMNIESSELTKYASNAMLATRISFMNELSNLAEKVGADINQVKIGMAKDRRIGPFFLNAGIGYGGSCFPKDVRALVATGLEYDCPMSIVQAVEDVNDKQRLLFTQQILKYFGDTISTKHLGIWGLAFKPETDDLRCAPSLDVVKILLENGAKITVYDPVAAEPFRALFANQVNYAKTSKEILEQCDGLIILTEWKEFLKYKPTDFNTLKEKVVFDGRNCFDPIEMHYSGIKYFCIGRNAIMRNTKNMLVQQELAQEEVL
ncbi:MAG: UDP-glucose/GDP-mannose dehydrogenase family protein [bacterium]